MKSIDRAFWDLRRVNHACARSTFRKWLMQTFIKKSEGTLFPPLFN
ncbi:MULTISPECIES: hypothetical protein [Bacillus cereus group]|nr:MULTISPECIES: hypothetical protein [Bacillus cereus group]